MIDFLRHSLSLIDDIDSFEDWVRTELRMQLPHASFLATVGRLYGVGSVPTHRLSVDFPLDLIENIKNSAGALDDPSIYGWFRSQKLRFINAVELENFDDHQNWKKVLSQYGFRSVMVHGILDHGHRRFAIFQMFNLSNGGSSKNIQLVSALVPDLALSMWRIFHSKRRELIGRRLVTGHPTLSLTATELHIVELLAQGLSNKEIARRRGVSDSTIKTQVQRTGAKVGATRRAEIVALALPFLSPLPPQTMIDYED